MMAFASDEAPAEERPTPACVAGERKCAACFAGATKG